MKKLKLKKNVCSSIFYRFGRPILSGLVDDSTECLIDDLMGDSTKDMTGYSTRALIINDLLKKFEKKEG